MQQATFDQPLKHSQDIIYSLFGCCAGSTSCTCRMNPERHHSKKFQGVEGHGNFSNVQSLVVCMSVNMTCIPVLDPHMPCDGTNRKSSQDPTCIRIIHRVCCESSVIAFDMLLLICSFCCGPASGCDRALARTLHPCDSCDGACPMKHEQSTREACNLPGAPRPTLAKFQSGSSNLTGIFWECHTLIRVLWSCSLTTAVSHCWASARAGQALRQLQPAQGCNWMSRTS